MVWQEAIMTTTARRLTIVAATAIAACQAAPTNVVEQWYAAMAARDEAGVRKHLCDDVAAQLPPGALQQSPPLKRVVREVREEPGGNEQQTSVSLIDVAGSSSSVLLRRRGDGSWCIGGSP
jgi:hypothetical protein